MVSNESAVVAAHGERCGFSGPSEDANPAECRKNHGSAP